MARPNSPDKPMKHTSKVRLGINTLFYLWAGIKRTERPINVRSFNFFCFISMVGSETTYSALSQWIVLIPCFFWCCSNNKAELEKIAEWLSGTSRFSCHASNFHSHLPDRQRPRPLPTKKNKLSLAQGEQNLRAVVWRANWNSSSFRSPVRCCLLFYSESNFESKKSYLRVQHKGNGLFNTN